MTDTSAISNATNWLTQQKPATPFLSANPLETISTLQSITNAQSQNEILKQDLINKRQELQNKQQELLTSQQDYGITGEKTIGDKLLSVLGAKDDDVQKQANELLNHERESGNHNTSVLDGLQKMVDRGDVGEIRRTVARLHALSVGGVEARKAMFPTASNLDTGGSISPVQTSGPLSGPMVGQPNQPGPNIITPVQPGITKTPQPQFQTTQDPDTLRKYITPSQPQPAPIIQGPGGTIAPAQLAAGGAPKPPGAPLQELGPGEAKTAEESAQGGVELAKTDNTRAIERALLDDMLTMTKVPGAFTGPDAVGYKTMMGRFAQIPGVVTPEVLAATGAQDQLQKAMANYQRLKMSSMLHTNQGLLQTILGSPHMELSTGGVPRIVHQLQGTTDAEEAMSQAWRQALDSGKTLPKDFQSWQSKFIAGTKDGQFDPRVFWLARMDDKEAQEFVKASPDRATLEKNYDYAISKGWIKK